MSAASDSLDIRYSYRGSPTLSQFARSNAFIRGLMGPFGCLGCDTEFLTPHGWRRMDGFRDGMLVAQWHHDTGRISFVEPTAYIVLPCDELIEFDSGSLVMQLSDEHAVPHYDWKGRFKTVDAAHMAQVPSKRTIPTAFTGALERADRPRWWTDDAIRFSVMMHADGHYPKEGTKATVTLRKGRKKERLRALLDRMGIAFEESPHGSRPTETIFRFVPPYIGKRFTGAWWASSQEELAIVLDEMKHWDGHDGEIIVYSSAEKEDADFIQYAAHANGLRAVIARVDYDNQNWRPTYRVSVRTGDNAKNRVRISNVTKIRRVRTRDGRKYCFAVPSGFFAVRCADTIFITGNSGKSSACIAEFPVRALEQRPGRDGIRRTRWAVVRNTYRELEDSTIRSFHQWLPPQHFGRWYVQDKRYVVTKFEKTEFEVLFRALDDPDDVKKLLSTEFTGAWVNEAREVPWSIIDALQGRVGRYPAMMDGGPTWFGIWMDTNPPDVESEWYSFFEDRGWIRSFEEMTEAGIYPRGAPPEEYAVLFKQPGGTNPLAENLPNLVGGYYHRLGIGKKADWKKVYIDGDYGFVSSDKLVYPEYSDVLHCRSIDPVDGITIYRSWDFGLTPACVLSQILPDGRWLVFDEMLSKSMGIDRFSDQVLEHCSRSFHGRANFEDYGDPAGNARAQTDERTCYDILRSKGVDIRPGEQDPTMRWECVRRPMTRLVNGEVQFILHPRCRQLRKGFLGGYHFRRLSTSSERYSDRAEKNSYCVPLTAEALTPMGWKKHDELNPGDPMYAFDLRKRRIVLDVAMRVNRFHGRYACVSIDGEIVATDAHRHLARTRAGVTKLLVANELNDGHSLVVAASEDRPRKQRPFSDEFISLAAWVMAEGTYRKTDGAVLLCQSATHNPGYCAYLDKLTSEFAGAITHTPRGPMRTWRIARETAWLLRHWMPDKVPSPEFIAAMCNSNRRRFLYEFLRGDGHAGGVMPDPGPLGRAEDFRPNGVTPRAFQKRKDAIDALQAMATLCGLRSVVREATRGYVITFLASNQRFGMQGRKKHAIWLNDVWCPTTKAGTWICRQNGRVFLTGNSHPHDALQYAATILFGGVLTAPPPEDDIPHADDTQDFSGRSAVTGY